MACHWDIDIYYIDSTDMAANMNAFLTSSQYRLFPFGGRARIDTVPMPIRWHGRRHDVNPGHDCCLMLAEKNLKIFRNDHSLVCVCDFKLPPIEQLGLLLRLLSIGIPEYEHQSKLYC